MDSTLSSRLVLPPLPVPIYSQMDERWNFHEGSNRHMCAPTCMKAVFDYYESSSFITTSPSMDDIVGAVASHDITRGATHNDQVLFFMQHQLLSWRRNWLVSQDVHWLIEHEYYSDLQVSSIKKQLDEESAYVSYQRKALESIMNALQNKCPVIASVKPGFSNNHSNHQVVITAASETEMAIMDPALEKSNSVLTLSPSNFFLFFNYRAIFTQPIKK